MAGMHNVSTCADIRKTFQNSPFHGLASFLIDKLRGTYVTHSRKRGPFLQKSDCELDLSVDSAKSVVHTREN